MFKKAKTCIYFTAMKKHCYNPFNGNYDEVATDCKLLNGKFCKKYKGGKNEYKH